MFDMLMQRLNYNETNGIIIGPEISRIFAEIIFQDIDSKVIRSLRSKGFKFNKDYVIKRYVDDLCKLIEMRQFGETQIVHFGENENVAGFSMLQLIETSLISGHFANKTNNAYIDIFSCKFYEPSVAKEFTQKFFEAKQVKMSYILRGNEFAKS